MSVPTDEHIAAAKKLLELDPLAGHYSEVGRLMSAWALIEFEMDLLIWDLAGVAHMPGACITTQIGSVSAKLRIIKALAELRGISAELSTKINKFSADNFGIAELRNRAAHDALMVGMPGNHPAQIRVAVIDNKLEFGMGLLPVQQVIDDRKKIKEHGDRFHELEAQIRAEALASPDKWSRQLTQINRNVPIPNPDSAPEVPQPQQPPSPA